MRAVVQRVSKASVTVDKERISEIGRGLQILVGISSTDSIEIDGKWMVQKLLNLRLFSDEAQKPWTRSVLDIEGDILWYDYSAVADMFQRESIHSLCECQKG
jgi:D-tyrosyl-tRNA(Tyr) deacylase